MQFPLLHLIIAVILFFPVLYYLVIPVFQRISNNLVDKGFRVGGFSPTDYHGDNPVGFFDVFMTFMCFATALAATMALMLYMGELGIIPKMPVKK